MIDDAELARLVDESKTYTLEFDLEARKELSKLDQVLQIPLLKKLKSRLLSP